LPERFFPEPVCVYGAIHPPARGKNLP
jgi:hypothetical protein